jgi:SAM-dependent methyltransferase
MAGASYSKVLAPVNRYYTEKIKLHGTTSLGVDWNSRESQELRFKQLTQMIDKSKKFSVNDFGCGYGSLYGFLKKNKPQYYGFDISAEMVEKAKQAYGNSSSAQFKTGHKPWKKADYGIASGIFNVRLKSANGPWKKYILKTLDEMNASSQKGFSFNCLTKYSDKPKMRPYLYYADPLFLFDYCKKKYSKSVALLHDYGLYEFTILVRKDI